MNSWVSKGIGVFCIFVALTMAVITGVFHWMWEEASPPKRLMILWQRDLQTLKRLEKLPDAWNDIKKVELTGGTKRAKKWSQKIRAPIPTKEDGNHRLEILLLSWEDKRLGTLGAIVQYNLVNLESKNMIWELGRTFELIKDSPEFLEKETAESATPVTD